MVIYRYLSRQLFATTVGVASVLVMILVCGRFIKYLAEAASGRISSDVVFLVMAYRLPGFLELILPLALFLGILLAYGRMYLENEMVVLEACGVSQTRLVYYTLIPALCLSAVVGLFSLYVGPMGAAESVQILEEQKRKSGLEVLNPGRFYASKDGRTVTYTEQVSSRTSSMENLFIVSYDEKDSQTVALLSAGEGRYRVDESTGARYLVLSNGTRFEGSPGQADFNQASYGQYEIKIEEQKPYDPNQEFENRTTLDLWQQDSPQARAELHWRISVPLLVPIVAFLAVPLSKVNPRQGRYLKLLPSIVIYLAYLSLLLAGKNAIAKGKINDDLGLIWIHLVFFLFACVVHFWPNLRLWVRKQRAAKTLSQQGGGV
ncbi:MAG: LPS export ABC transporter permease LptF [Gammaproteobacteria bacterium]|nr:MAG: LPS export ABC transporter permease LptF [Gammaproteobacteria bacterium]